MAQNSKAVVSGRISVDVKKAVDKYHRETRIPKEYIIEIALAEYINSKTGKEIESYVKDRNPTPKRRPGSS